MSYALNYVCRPSKVNKKGIANIELSISVNRERVFMSLPYKCSPSDFAKSMSSRRKNDIKDFCNAYSTKVQNAITEMVQLNMLISASSIKNYIVNVGKVYTIKEFTQDYLRELGKKVDVDMTLDRWVKYQKVCELFLEIVDNDSLPLKDLSNMHAQSFINHCKKNYKDSTSKGKITILKTIMSYAMSNKLIDDDIFKDIKVKYNIEKIEIFKESEYVAMRDKKIENERLSKVRDFLIFACNSGIAYADIIKLKKDDFEIVGKKVVVDKCRVKTGVPYYSVILPDGIKVLEKYDYDLSSLMISNQKVNSYAKEIQTICNITSVDSLHCHMMRHFYITHLLRKGVPVAVVQKCAGHSNIKTTINYTHLLNEDILKQVNKHCK